MLLYILEENLFFFINHCGVTTCGQTDQEPVKLSKAKAKQAKASMGHEIQRKKSVTLCGSRVLANLCSISTV